MSRATICNGCVAVKLGFVVFVSIDVNVVLSDYWSSATLGVLPPGFRPPVGISAPVAMTEMPTTARLAVLTDGTVKVANMSGTAIPGTRQVYATITFVVEP